MTTPANVIDAAMVLSPLAVSLREPAQNPIWMLVAAFALAAGLVWIGGTYLSRFADAIAERTGLGRAFAGVLLLGGATSLPELATTSSAAALGNAGLAGSNLLGGVALQLAVLAAIDALVVRRGALTFFTPKPGLLMQGVMLVMLMSLAGAAIVAGDRWAIWGVGPWSMVLFGTYVLGLWVIRRYEGDPRWEPTGDAGESEPGEPPLRDSKDDHHRKWQDWANWQLYGGFALAALAVLVGGFFVARTGDAMAVKTGIDGSIVGATLLALATSLPEVSTTWSAVQLKAYGMAMANILGANALQVALLFIADGFYREGPLINAMGGRAAFLAALAAVLTCVYLWGLLERQDRTLFGIGIDSLIVLVLYLGGLVVFYFIQGG